ncbi:NADH ubiquinone oxidoreductase subunit, putative [Phytophthora infestans T30-4]|uniref:NADH dehydrogenase [ubiquinone] 1 alpha subcomplex subunit 12 n=2 Tax=Phytophthora infestans TaxID=4787 RepID=D0NA03_PHYIT|nr:NADH ubiquinone oxidoreductase subunit, putative [Phytophthora infestans T30-4]XP_002904079.1 NADH ubiquinone oxidoreductase subunit, putative [Phytophthora infestans T30-4]KAF4043748.1 NADH ubiquinone oxidoreductase subunit NDUFA12 [Phytophthora infestans]EEY54257.1 NADH ubiquinone oxidoreductase subunit, putative [Phytophthora infestans T30-4]EEY55113.1 NADH ubiquinone oxidoreductase subunit, putative [Phytophthora infestans T30-4]KAF4130728.1 NADH ubiquinone oxidoreductase subunit NDUFA1|eukprot:XP_002895702.1 NADH ubiquinone oxidoreductase subunit, putative [Phytophthora infestans T30-4]
MVIASGRHSALALGGRLIQRQSVALVKSMQTRSFYTVFEKYLEANKRYGWKGALWKLYNPGDVKFGRFVGEDENGFKYYEDPTEVYGQHRWTEYKVDSWDEVEGTLIGPQWHLWMHHVTDSLPGEGGQLPENWEKRETVAHSDAPYVNHLGQDVLYYPNKTLYRSRGYNVGSVAINADEPDQYYMQPGHLRRTRKRKAHYFADVDYNNPEYSDESRADSLRPADIN